MKNINITIAILALIISTSINATPVGTGFNYQGELIENGQAVDSPRVFSFSLFDAETDGNQATPPIEFGVGGLASDPGIEVINGIFNINNIDFGDVYTGDELWLEVSVRLPNVFLCGVAPNPACNSLETLTPRQKIKAVPYAVQADYLGPLGASNGDVLKFSAGEWTPTADTGSSPWTESGSNVSYDGTVGIGGTTIANVDLYINSDTGRAPLLARINNIPKLSVNTNGGTTLGFLLELPPVDGLLVKGVSNLRDDVLVGGNLGIGGTSLTADFGVEATSDGGVMQASIDGIIRFRLDANAGMTIGENAVAPANGLRVAGLTMLKSTTDASLSNGSGVLLIGQSTGNNLIMDGNEIMARDNGANSTLLLQHDGGQVRINSITSSDASLSGGGSLQIGNATGANLVFDRNEIMARNNGDAATLFIAADGGISTDGTANNKGMLSIGANASQITFDGDDIQKISNGSPAGMFLNWYGGNVTIGSSGATTNIRGTFTNTSDKRFKTEIEDLSYGLAEILVLQPKKYNWINSDNENKSFGLIAQDVHEVMQELVHTSDDKMQSLSLSYIELIPVLIKAVQEQQVIIDQQDKKIERLIMLMENRK